MAFNAEEKDFLNSIFEKKIDEEKIQKYVSESVFHFLKTKQHLQTIKDRIIFREENEYRPFSSCVFTKFISAELDLKELLTDLCEIMTPDYLIFLDFHFLITCHGSKEEEEDTEELVFKFQRGSKASCINETIKISNATDLDLLLGSFKNFSNADFLNQAFVSHSELFDYRGSGLRPYSLLSLLVHIQKIK